MSTRRAAGTGSGSPVDPQTAHAYRPVADNWLGRGSRPIQVQGSGSENVQWLAVSGHLADRRCACGKAIDGEVHFAIRDDE
jgi:hypothetical protein